MKNRNMKIIVEFVFDAEKHILEFNQWIGDRPRWLKAETDNQNMGRN